MARLSKGEYNASKVNPGEAGNTVMMFGSWTVAVNTKNLG